LQYRQRARIFRCQLVRKSYIALGLEPILTSATVAFFERSGRLGLQPVSGVGAAGMDEVVRLFDERLPPATPGGANARMSEIGRKAE
jgi:hypothetical protein